MNEEHKLSIFLEKVIQFNFTDAHFKISPNESKVIFRRYKEYAGHLYEDVELIYQMLKYKSRIFNDRRQINVSRSFEYINDKVYYFRFSVIENYFYKTAALRLLNIKDFQNISDLYNKPSDEENFKRFQNIDHGLIIFAGKTGSGKSTTMIKYLESLHPKQIYSFENPIELVSDKIFQLDIDLLHMPLNVAIDQVLRHDPDVIAIQEARSEAELKSVVRASLTGHLVVTSIHSGNLDDVILRLNNLGADLYELSQIIKGVIFQKIEKNRRENQASFKFLHENQIKKEIQKRIK